MKNILKALGIVIGLGVLLFWSCWMLAWVFLFPNLSILTNILSGLSLLVVLTGMVYFIITYGNYGKTNTKRTY